MLMNSDEVKHGEQLSLDMDFSEALTRFLKVNTKDIQQAAAGEDKEPDDIWLDGCAEAGGTSHAAGAACCTRLGAQPSLPTRAAVERLLHSHRSRART